MSELSVDVSVRLDEPEHHIITSYCLDEDERMDFLPRHAGDLYLAYEYAVYQLMAKACNEYDGGYWDYMDLSNGGFYMLLTDANSDKQLFMQWDGNYYRGEMSLAAASIGINLFAQNRFANKPVDKFTEYYYQLRNFAAQHVEACEIFRFID